MLQILVIIEFNDLMLTQIKIRLYLLFFRYVIIICLINKYEIEY